MHNQEGQHQTTLGTPHPPSLGSAFRIYNLDIEAKQRNGRVEIINLSDHSGG